MSRERLLTTVFVFAVTLALVVLGWFFITSYRLVTLTALMREAGHPIVNGVAALEELSWDDARNDFSDAHNRFSKIEAGLTTPSFTLLSHAPTTKRVFGFALSSVRIASETSADLVDVLDWVTTALPQSRGELLLSGLSPEGRIALLRTLAESPTRFARMRAHLHEADQLIASFPERAVFGVAKDDLTELKQELSAFVYLFDGVLDTASLLPMLVGYPREATYLVLLQNNTELRPTGGFIGTVGGLTFRGGMITNLTTEGVYNLDRPSEGKIVLPTPPPLERYGATRWLFLRDANWSPDFPTSAAGIHQLYLSERANAPHLTTLPTNPQFIVAFTPTLIERLLAITGPVTVKGKTFTAERSTHDLEFEVEIGYASKGIPQEERKAIVGDLAQALLAKVLMLPPAEWPRVIQVFHNAVAERHLMVWAKDVDLQRDIVANGWGASVEQPLGDYLMVVDANLSSLKTDPAVDRTIRWKIAPNGKGYRATVTVHYNHKGTFDWKTTRYRSYTRIYVPKGSKLVTSRGALDRDRPKTPGTMMVDEELDKTVFGAFISIEPGEQYDLEVTYDLPANIVDQIHQKRYTAMIQKQSGTVGHAYEADFNFGSTGKVLRSRGVLTHDVVLTPL